MEGYTPSIIRGGRHNGTPPDCGSGVSEFDSHPSPQKGGTTMQQTKIPSHLSMLCNAHILGMGTVVRWLEDLGIVIYHKRHILQTTVFDIHIRHSNDYVEMGPLDDDPEGERFYCYTSQPVQFEVPYEIRPTVGQALKNNQCIGDERIGDNIEIATDMTNQFTMQKHVHHNDWNWEKCEFSIEFRIHHTFNEEV